MGSLNKVILIGRLGRDAELKYTPSGASVSNFSMATTESWKDKQGNKQERTEWHRITLWGKAAETLTPYLTKGKEICVEGRIQSREYEKDGQKHRSVDIVADRIVLLAGGPRREQAPAESSGGSGDWDGPAQPITDDDIPF